MICQNKACRIIFFTSGLARYLILLTIPRKFTGKAGGPAHDLNNLHQGIFGFIYLAKQEKNNPERCGEMLENAEEVMDTAIQLTNQLLTFSKGSKTQKKKSSSPPSL